MVAQPDERDKQTTASVLETDTEHCVTSGSNEIVLTSSERL